MTIALFLLAGIVMFLLTNWFSSLVGPHTELVVVGLVVGLSLFAIGLYSLRARFRLLYGLLELASGVVMLGAINSYSAALGRENVPIVGGGIFHRPPEGWLHWSAPSVSLLGVAAAVYILVRGLDNVGEGLSELSNPKWSAMWQRCFGKR
jgi:hypothetical protein